MPTTAADAAVNVSGPDADHAGFAEIARRLAVPFAFAVVALAAATVAVGLLITHDVGGVSTLDLEVGQALAERRSPGIDDLAGTVGTVTGPFPIAAACAAAIGVAAVVTRRWTIPVCFAVALGGEALVFLIASVVVGRPRPPVEPIGQVYATSSFPSGHVGFAIILVGGVFVAGLWHHASAGRPVPRGVLVAAVAVTVLVGLTVAWARVWAGHHHVTDVVWGALLGALWLTLAWRLVLAPAPEPSAP